MSNKPKHRNCNTSCLCGHLRSQHNFNHVTGRGSVNYGSECDICTCIKFEKDDMIERIVEVNALEHKEGNRQEIETLI